MACHPVRTALLLGAITAVAVSPARAQTTAPAHGPAMRTIQVTECVPETYQVKRTVYRMECRTQPYDTFRCECVPVCKERVCTVIRKVPEMRTEVRKVCCNKWVCEERCVMKRCYEYKKVTCMVKKCVALGHWECREACHKPGIFDHLFHHNDCCDPCAKSCCNKTRTKKVWVYCPQYKECPVTRCQRVCVMKPVTHKVRVCKPQVREEKVQVCSYRCVPEKRVEKYTVYETRKVPCKGTRTVRVCVPHEEVVTCCRMVPRTVTRQVPECCETPRRCCPGLFHRQHGDSCH